MDLDNRAKWFGNTGKPEAGSSVNFLRWFDLVSNSLSVRSRNVLKVVVENESDFRRLFLESEDLVSEILKLRNAGRKSAEEISEWWGRLSLLILEDGVPGSEIIRYSKNDQHDRLSREKFDELSIARMAFSSIATLSVRSQNVLKRFIKSENDVVRFLLHRPNLVAFLGHQRGLGKKSIDEIVMWIDEIKNGWAEEFGNITASERERVLTRFSDRLLIMLKREFSQMPDFKSISEYQGVSKQSRRLISDSEFAELWLKTENSGRLKLVDDPLFEWVWIECGTIRSEVAQALNRLGLWLAVIQLVFSDFMGAEYELFNSRGQSNSWKGFNRFEREMIIWLQVKLHQRSINNISGELGLSSERIRQILTSAQKSIDKAFRGVEMKLPQKFIAVKGDGFVISDESGEWKKVSDLGVFQWNALGLLPAVLIGEQIYISEKLGELVYEELKGAVLRQGAIRRELLFPVVDYVLGGYIAPRIVVNFFWENLNECFSSSELLRRKIVSALKMNKKALDLSEIRSIVGFEFSEREIKTQLHRVLRDKNAVSVGKRGYYTGAIPGFDGSSLHYDDAVYLILRENDVNHMPVGQIIYEYKSLVGLECDFSNIWNSLKFSKRFSSLGLQFLPFYHVGLKSKESQAIVSKEKHANVAMITANLNHFPGAIPPPNSKSGSRWIENASRSLNQPIEILELALWHRFWLGWIEQNV